MHLKSLAFVAAAARRMVNRHHRKIAKIGPEKTTFIVISLYVHSINHLIGLLFRQDSHTAVAFFLCRKPKILVAQGLKFHQGNLVGCRFNFLKTKHIGRLGSHPVQKTPVDSSPDAIDVVGDNFHSRRNKGRKYANQRTKKH